MDELKYTFMTDTLVKMLFVRHQHLLQKLIAQLLSIPFESIERFVITNPEMPPESLGDKYCRLDINMVVDGRRINLEFQVENEGNYPERALFHWAREYSSSLPSGGNYRDLPQVIIISIVDFSLLSCEEYHSEFMALEVSRHTPLSEKLVMHFFELPKIPELNNADDDLLLWLSLFKAKSEVELKRIEEMEVPEMSEAIGAYRSITVSPEFKEAERLRAKARHDEAQALLNERIKMAREIALSLTELNLSDEEIAKHTRLSIEDIRRLRRSES